MSRGKTSAKEDDDPFASAYAALAESSKQIQELAELQGKFFESMLNAAPHILAAAASSAFALQQAILSGLSKANGGTGLQNLDSTKRVDPEIKDFDVMASKMNEVFAAAVKAALTERSRQRRPRETGST